MALKSDLEKAARAADLAVKATMSKYSNGLVTDEDDITGVLVGRLDSAFDGQIGGVLWSSTILRHRKGVAAQEKMVGADMLLHVSLKTPQLTYSKGVLIQSKRVDKGSEMSNGSYKDLTDQCKKMLSISQASYVFNYTKSGMRCASASEISGTNARALNSSCNLSSYDFFLRLFECSIGDHEITSARVDGLRIPVIVALKGEESA